MEAATRFSLRYPERSGFTETDISVQGGTPDLVTFFYCDSAPEDEAQCRLFITDSTVAALPCVRSLTEHMASHARQNDALIVLGAGEAYKTIDSVLAIVTAALDHNFTRNSIFIGIGGGVICDMAGFAASLFKRGVQAAFVPTTLLADVDASIGGKTGCDFASYKNMIGAFYPAQAVYMWSGFIHSLNETEYRSGLAEAIKTALLFSPQLCHTFKEERAAILARDEAMLKDIISTCAREKAQIVQRDFKEKGERAFLNYGHTFGHALESVAGLGAISHGEAVAWGMGRALELAANAGICTRAYADEVTELLALYGYDTASVPAVLRGRNDAAAQLLQAMYKDKKNTSTSRIRFIVQSDYCRTLIHEAQEHDIMAVLQ